MVNNKEKQVDLLLELLSANIDKTSSSIILDRIEKFLVDSHDRNEHDSHDRHCKHSSSGGGHLNVCWADKITEDLSKINSGKGKEVSR
ncbi:MAG: hypothetical protein ACR5LA_12270 [Wolbachia sp.]